MSNIFFPEGLGVYELLQPATDAAGRTGLYTSLKYAQKAWVIFHVAQGNAGTILVTVLQAQDEEGTGSKVLANNIPVWTVVDTATIDQPTRQTDAKNYTTDAGLKNKVVIFQIDPTLLDVANGFNAIGISTGASNVANLTSALLLVDGRYDQPLPPHAADLD